MTPLPRERLVTWTDPMAIAEEGRRSSGLAFLQRMAKGDVPMPPAARLTDFRIVEASDGRVVFEYDPHESHYNPLGGVHGGVIASVFDAALGCSIHTKLPQGTGYTTLDLHTNFLRPVSAASGTLRCEAVALHVGRRQATASARLTDPSGKLIAHATTTCMILGGEK